MADDNTLREYRTNDPSRRNPGPSSQAAPDPLAELARLIGQNDPFLASDRGASRSAATREPAPQPSRKAPTVDWRRHIERPDYAAMREQPMPPPEPDFVPLAPTAPVAGDFERDPYRMASPQPRMDYAEPDARREPQFSPAKDEELDEHTYATPRHHEMPGNQGAYGDEAYDDPPRSKESSKLVTAVVLIGCAMLGTASAYGYRTYSASAGPSQAPVIVADTSPSKVVPNPPGSKSTRTQDRFSGSGGEEKLVPRQEQPVTIQPGSGSPPRVVFPPPGPTASPPPAAAAPPAPAPPTTGSTKESSNSNSAEPKRVRTLTIRPDGSDSSSRPVGPPDASGGAPKADQKIPSAKVTPPPRGNAPAPRGTPAPLSLDPSAAAEPAEAPRGKQRPLTPPAPKEAAGSGPKLASVPPSGGGGYLVQVSSQRTEAEAKSSYRSLQSKYSQLKSREAIVRRADLGSKGTFYRAFVGPFASANEANRFCDSLKSAGGQCIILRN